jgi:hypothetical protein
MRDRQEINLCNLSHAHSDRQTAKAWLRLQLPDWDIQHIDLSEAVSSVPTVILYDGLASSVARGLGAGEELDSTLAAWIDELSGIIAFRATTAGKNSLLIAANSEPASIAEVMRAGLKADVQTAPHALVIEDDAALSLLIAEICKVRKDVTDMERKLAVAGATLQRSAVEPTSAVATLAGMLAARTKQHRQEKWLEHLRKTAWLEAQRAVQAEAHFKKAEVDLRAELQRLYLAAKASPPPPPPVEQPLDTTPQISVAPVDASQIDALQNEIRQRDEYIGALLQSTSWRVTRPLRSVRLAFRRIGGRE